MEKVKYANSFRFLTHESYKFFSKEAVFIYIYWNDFLFSQICMDFASPLWRIKHFRQDFFIKCLEKKKNVFTFFTEFNILLKVYLQFMLITKISPDFKFKKSKI